MASKRADDEDSPKPPTKRMRSADGSSKASKTSSSTLSPKKVTKAAAAKATKVSANGQTKKKAPAKKAAKPKSPTKKPATTKAAAAKGKKKGGGAAAAAVTSDEDYPENTVTNAKSTATTKAKPGGRGKKAVPAAGATKGKANGKAKKAASGKKEDAPWKPTLCSTGLDESQIDMLEQIVAKKKSKLLTDYDARVTHMIVNSFEADEVPKRTMKLCKAIAGGQSIVCFKWIQESIGVSTIWKDPREYLHPLTRDPKTTNKLFADMEFYFGALGSFNSKKGDLIEIIKLGGGKILFKKPEEPPPLDLSQESEDTEPPTSKLMLVEQSAENDKQRSARRASLASLAQAIPGATLIAPSWILDECCTATRKEQDKNNDGDDEMEGNTDKMDVSDDEDADLDDAKKKKAMVDDEDAETEEDEEMKGKTTKKKSLLKKPVKKKASPKKKAAPNKAAAKKAANKKVTKKKDIEEEKEEEKKEEEKKNDEEKEEQATAEAKKEEGKKDLEKKKEEEAKKEVIIEATADDEEVSDLEELNPDGDGDDFQ